MSKDNYIHFNGVLVLVAIMIGMIILGGAILLAGVLK